jgi:hypothetical protein
MPSRVHPVMQNAHDLDDAGLDGEIENHMNRIAYRRFAAFGSAVPDVARSAAF